MTTAEVAERLGVKPATVYAYASRGLLTSKRTTGRSSTFDRAEVERLATRSRSRPDPSQLNAPVVSSELTRIDDGRYWYRGEDVLDLARSGRPFEEVATWLWTGSFDTTRPWERAPVALPALPDTALPLDRMRVATVAASVADALRYDTSSAAVTAAARNLLVTLVEALPLVGAEPPTGCGVARRLWPRLTVARPKAGRVRLLDAALVLMADHELPVSTLAARLAASTGAHVYAVVSAGLGAIDGPRHGGASLAAESLLAEIAGGKPAATAVGERLRRGERIPGFGQPLYPAGDPRATLLLEMLAEAAGPRTLRPVHDLIEVMDQRSLPKPNVDLALATLAQTTAMIPGAGEAVFAVARTAGWVAHALEEYANPTTYRPRAVYTGV